MKTIRLDGIVGLDILASDVSKALVGESKVKLVLNSGGGDILEGFSIYNVIKGFKGYTEAHVDFAGSMMSVIAMAANKRVMKENSSILMTHRPWGGAVGNSEELRSTADTLDKLESMLVNIYSGVSGMSADESKEYLSVEQYLTAQEAFEIGLIDEIDTGKADLALVAMAGMRAKEHVNFDLTKFCAKMESMTANKTAVIKNAFDNCESLREVERVIRDEYKLSQSAATAIVGAVKKQCHGERDLPASEKNELDASSVRNLFNQFEIGKSNVGIKNRT